MRFNAFEPGFNPSTGLGRETSVFIRLLLKYVLPLLAPFYPKRAARVVTKILINESCQTGLYYDDGRRPMLGSALICDPKFTDRVVAGK